MGNHVLHWNTHVHDRVKSGLITSRVQMFGETQILVYFFLFRGVFKEDLEGDFEGYFRGDLEGNLLSSSGQLTL